MKKLSIAVIFMGAFIASPFAMDDQNTQMTLYSKVQSSGLKSHVTELSEKIREFLKKQNAEREDSSSAYWFGGVRNLVASGMRQTGNLCRNNADSKLAELATAHINSYVAAQESTSVAGLASYAASWDSTSVWKYVGAGLRTVGYATGTKTSEELALEEGALDRFILDFCESKHIEPKGDAILPLAATALMLCHDAMGGGYDDVVIEYNRLVQKFRTRVSLQPLPNAVVAVDYLVEGICHYVLLDYVFVRQQNPVECLRSHLMAWSIDPCEMLSCTALVDKAMVTAGMPENEVRQMTLDAIDNKINERRKTEMENFVKHAITKSISKIQQSLQSETYKSNLKSIKSTLKIEELN